MTSDDMAAKRLEALDEQRRSYGLAQMEYPQLVRWIHTEEIASVMVPCLTEKGFVVTANASGTGYTGPVPSAQNQAFATAVLECEAMYSVDPRLHFDGNDPERIGLVYDYWSEFLIPCVRELGYEMADLPTKPVWIADPQPLADYPFGDAQVSTTCPYNAPSVALLGEG